MRKTFLRVLKFLQIKEGGPNFLGEPVLQNVWIIWSPLLYLNLKSPMDSNSSSFIRFQSILHERKTFFRVLKFLQIKDGGPNFCGEPILQNVWITWSPLLYLNLKSLMDPNSWRFITLQFILDESGRLFSESLNFCNLRRGDRISGGNQFCRMSELFIPPFYISILKLF